MQRFLLLVVAVLLPACVGPCHVGDSFCTGNTLTVCGGPDEDHDGSHWDTAECQACVADGATHICALTPQPIPECANRGQTCWNNQFTDCTDGYPTYATSCGQKECVAGSDGPFCGTADARCSSDGVVCSGTSLITCLDGYLTDETVCPALCLTVATSDRGDQSFCALSDQPDPQCRITFAGQLEYAEDGYCDGMAAVSCMLGYDVTRESCDAAHPCYPHPAGWVECL